MNRVLHALHPNRVGYQAMGMAIDLGMFGVRAR